MINGFANFLFAYRMHSTLQIVRSEEHLRQTRSALKPLGFFGKLAYMGGLLFQVCADLWLLNVLLRWDFLQQYNETTNAFGSLRDILNDQFSDTATKGVSRRSMRRQLSHGFNCLLVFVSSQPPVEVTTDEDGETTTEKYRISRAEFGKIVNRNFRGLQKLFRIEVADAKNVSEFFVLLRHSSY